MSCLLETSGKKNITWTQRAENAITEHNPKIIASGPTKECHLIHNICNDARRVLLAT
jgi:hypothetical protein